MHPYRTHTCGELRPSHVNAIVRLSGWLTGRRDLGGLLFLEIADAHGSTQLVVTSADDRRRLRALRLGDLMTVTGIVQQRATRNENARQDTGSVEVLVEEWRPWPSLQTGDDSSRATARDLLPIIVGTARRILFEVGFVELDAEAPIWTRSLSRGQADRRARITRWQRRVLLELDAAFVTESDVTDIVAHLIVGVGAECNGGADMAPVGHRSWSDLPSAPDPWLAWVEGPDRLSASRADFPHDPCGILFALPRDHRSDDPTEDVFRSPVSAFELWSNRICLGTGSIRNHDCEVQARLCEALRGAGPTVRERAANHLEALRRGLPPSGWFTLDLGELIARSVRAPMRAPVRSAPRSDPTPQGLMARWSGFESALTTMALEGGRLSPNEMRRRKSRAERRDTEAAAAVLASLQVDISLTKPVALDPGVGLARLLTASAISVGQCESLLDLFPGQKPRILALPADELYQWLWSILGNDFVRELIDDSVSYAQVKGAIADGVVTEYRQLVYLDQPALSDLATCRLRYGNGAADETRIADAELTSLLRRILAEQPASFSSILAAMADATDATRSEIARTVAGGRRGETMIAAARSALCGPLLLPVFLEARERPALLEALTRCLSRQTAHLYPNRPVDAAARAFDVADDLEGVGFSHESMERIRKAPCQFFADLVVALYRPVNMSVRTITALLSGITDGTRHFEQSGIRAGGQHWDDTEACFVVPISSMGGAALRLYPSKNVASFFSKTSAGICTARDVDLYARPSHLHLNIVAPDGVITAGNVQLHALVDRGKRVLLVRAINVSATWLTVENAQDLVNAVLISALELASSSAFDEVHVGEGLDLWHLNSGRAEIRCVLDEYENRLERVVLEEPLFLFRFSGIDHRLARSYRLWPLPPALREFAGLGLPTREEESCPKEKRTSQGARP